MAGLICGCSAQVAQTEDCESRSSLTYIASIYLGKKDDEKKKHYKIIFQNHYDHIGITPISKQASKQCLPSLCHVCLDS